MAQRRKSFKENRNNSTKPNNKGSIERRSFILLSFAVIITFSYLAFRNDDVNYTDLKTIEVTLIDTPKYLKYKVKSSTYEEIILSTKEYEKKFIISSMAFKATDHKKLKSLIFLGDKIELQVDQKDNLEIESSLNKNIEVFGLFKSNYNFIDLDIRNSLLRKDKKWSYMFILCGLVILPYGFIKRNPKIEMETALFLTILVCIIVSFMV